MTLTTSCFTGGDYASKDADATLKAKKETYFNWVVAYRMRTVKSSRWIYDLCQVNTDLDLVPHQVYAKLIRNRYGAYQVEVIAIHRLFQLAVLTLEKE